MSARTLSFSGSSGGSLGSGSGTGSGIGSTTCGGGATSRGGSSTAGAGTVAAGSGTVGAGLESLKSQAAMGIARIANHSHRSMPCLIGAPPLASAPVTAPEIVHRSGPGRGRLPRPVKTPSYPSWLDALHPPPVHRSTR
ncbi:MAG TPA: hypothetical protein EYN40_02490 [Planctomycetes bacterium]|nr:hypothetical protein [Planctomycetota bacterium]